MKEWIQYLIGHYTKRLKEETRTEAKAFLRTTLYQLKNYEPDLLYTDCSFDVVDSNHLG